MSLKCWNTVSKMFSELTFKCEFFKSRDFKFITIYLMLETEVSILCQALFLSSGLTISVENRHLEMIWICSRKWTFVTDCCWDCFFQAPVRNPGQFKALGLVTPAGVLLAGPPGCGKTLLAKVWNNSTACILFLTIS